MATRRIDALVAAHLNAGGPGVAVGVLLDDDIVHESGYGLSNVETGVPMTPDTAFRICSVTKQFTCLLIAMLEHEGILDMDESPCTYLPQMPSFARAVTLRQLAQNVSGLRDYWCLAMLTGAQAETRFRREDAQRIIFGQRDFHFEPGTQYSYNNGNFAILGWIIESVTGKPYTQVLRERILEPLGMHSSFISTDTSSPLPEDSTGYEPSPDGGLMPAPVDIHWDGDAGIVSTLGDLLRWERNFAEDALAPRGSVEALFEAPVFPGGARSGYARGLHLGSHRGFALHTHQGGLRGWRMCRVRFPAERLSVIVLCNHLADAGALALDIADGYLPGARQPVTDPSVAEPWHEHLGLYLDRTSGQGFELLERNATLTLNAMGADIPLREDGEHSFVSDDGELRFTLGVNGERTAVLRSTASNYSGQLTYVDPPSRNLRMTGVFKSEALDSTITLTADDEGLAVAIEGPLGRVTDWPVRLIADDVAMLECKRALDYHPPGEFLLWLQRDEAGDACELLVSCGLARGVSFSAM